MVRSKPVGSVQYSIEGSQVFYTHHYVGRQLVIGADAATFTPLTDPILSNTDKQDWHFAGRDRASMWFVHTRIDEADPASFRYFHGSQRRWWTDASHIFCLYVSERPRVKVVKSSAAGSFRFLDEPLGAYTRQYALSDQRVYYYYYYYYYGQLGAGRRPTDSRGAQVVDQHVRKLECAREPAWSSGRVSSALGGRTAGPRGGGR